MFAHLARRCAKRVQARWSGQITSKSSGSCWWQEKRPRSQGVWRITIQCLEGAVKLEAHERTQILRAGNMVYLSDAEPHAVKALEDSSLLITILLRRT